MNLIGMLIVVLLLVLIVRMAPVGARAQKMLVLVTILLGLLWVMGYV